jgi:predicted dehydrogenase
MQPFRFAIVGTGNISKTYFNAIKNLPEAEIVGVVSRSAERAREVARERDLPTWGTSLTQLDTDYDAVILALPNGLHRTAAVEAAELGKHVLTEKVLDISREGCDAMIQSCEQAKVKLAVAYQRRTSPDNQSVRQLLQSGQLGRPLAADLSVKFYRDQAYYDSGAYRGTRSIDGGGPFMQQAAHNLDIFTWFFGLPVEIKSVLGRLGHGRINVEDHGAALLRYDNGMLGTIVASTIAKPGFTGKLDLHTSKGSLTLDNDVITFWAMEGLANPSTREEPASHTGRSAAVTNTQGHEAIILDFVDAVRQDRPPLGSGRSAALATGLIAQIYDASGFYDSAES